MQNVWIDFRHVKDSVTLDKVFDRYALSFRSSNGDSEMRGNCPLPMHGSKKSKDSFGANIRKQIWSCQSDTCIDARNGRRGGNLLDFVACMEQCSIRDAALKVCEWFSIQDAIRQQKPGDGNGSGNEPLILSRQYINPRHEYFEQRGILPETVEFFEAGFYTGIGSMQNRIVIPIFDEIGQLLGYAGRAIDDVTEPKYRLPRGLKKSLVLFNLHRALENGDTVIVVEGFFGVMQLHQAGFRNVVALMGSFISEPQEDLLADHFNRVVVMLDGDEAGHMGTGRIVSRLSRKVFVRCVDLADGVQPDHLSAEDIAGLLNGIK